MGEKPWEKQREVNVTVLGRIKPAQERPVGAKLLAKNVQKEHNNAKGL